MYSKTFMKCSFFLHDQITNKILHNRTFITQNLGLILQTYPKPNVLLNLGLKLFSDSSTASNKILFSDLIKMSKEVIVSYLMVEKLKI